MSDPNGSRRRCFRLTWRIIDSPFSVSALERRPFHKDRRSSQCSYAKKKRGNVVELRSGMGLIAIINIEAHLLSDLLFCTSFLLLNRLSENRL